MRFWHRLSSLSQRRRDRSRTLVLEHLEERNLLTSVIHPNYVDFTPAGNGPAGLSSPWPNAFTPTGLRQAYGLNLLANDGTGQTIAIIDAFDNPSFVSRSPTLNLASDTSFLASDLHLFDLQYGLPEPVGFFTKVNQSGGTTYPGADPVGAGNNNWEGEIALDVEWVHALAPGANIVLVEANDNTGNLYSAVSWAVSQPNISVISMSWGGDEFANETNLDTTNFNFPHALTFVASTGDSGQPAEYPAFSPNVLAVGGTTLSVSGGNWSGETGWSGSGGGVSLYESQQIYQTSSVPSSITTSQRAVPDIAFDANPNSGVSVYDSFNGNSTGGPWYQFGGTSLSAPCWAAMISIADQIRTTAGLGALSGRSQTLPILYSLPASDYHDVTSGNNGASAQPGYDLVTGIGTPIANLLIPDLAAFRVDATTPSAKTSITSTPTVFTVTFSDAVLSTSIHANTLQVNGISATTVSLNAAKTVATFTYATSPVTAEGTQTIAIAAGAVTSNLSATTTNVAYTSTFTKVPSLVTVANANPSTLGGLTTNLTVLGGSLAGEPSLSYTWSATSTPVGAPAPIFSINGTNAAKNTTATFSKAATYLFTVTIADATGPSNTSSVSVTVNQTLTSIVVTPGSATLFGASSQQYSAIGFDQFGNAMSIQPTITWSTNLGSISTGGLLTVPNASGTGLVSATSGSIVGTSTVVVTTDVSHFAIVLPTSETAGVAFSITIVAQTASNAFATNYVGTIHFTFSDPALGVIVPVDYKFIAGDSGVHSFTTPVLITAGTSLISVRDTISLGINNSVNTNVVAGPATNLTISPSTMSVTAGSPLILIVTASDAYSNTATSYSGIIQITSSDPLALLPANASLSSGIGYFIATPKTAGGQTFTSRDTVNVSLTATSNTITVNPDVTSQLIVSTAANTLTGANFSITVTAKDSQGNVNSNYTGTIHFTSSDSQATLPANYTFLASEHGVHIFTNSVKLVTPGSQSVTATDIVTASILGTANITVLAPPTHFSIVTSTYPFSGESQPYANVAFSILVKALDNSGNVVPSYTGAVHFSSSDSAAGALLPPDYTFVAGDLGQHTFSGVTFQTTGYQTILATDVSTSGSTRGTSGSSTPLLVAGLVAASVSPHTNGFSVTFSQPLNPAQLSLYGIGTNIVPAVTLAGAISGKIPGSLIVNATNTTIQFVATSSFLLSLTSSSNFAEPILPDDTYTITLTSGGNGFKSSTNLPLDGASNGGAANFTTTFTTAYQANATTILGLADFARGPDNTHPIKVPNSGGAGIPISIYNDPTIGTLTDVTFTLHYNPNLLTITGTNVGDASDPGSIFSLISNNALTGIASFSFHDANVQDSTLAGVILGDIVATVPTASAAGSAYGSKEILAFDDTLTTINNQSQSFWGVGQIASQSAIHLDAYLGDVTGNGTVDGTDAVTAKNVARGTDTGFAHYKLLDPTIVGDVAGSGSVDASSVTSLLRFAAFLPVAQIPTPPTGVTVTQVGADPTLSLLPSLAVDQAGIVNIPVLLDHPDPQGSTGMIEAILALSYDPSALHIEPRDITLGTIPSAGTGWQLQAEVDAKTGQIGITIFSIQPITNNVAGSLVNLQFHVVSNVKETNRVVQLLASTTPNGRYYPTQIDDTESLFVLSPAPTNVPGAAGFTTLVTLPTRFIHAIGYESFVAKVPIKLPTITIPRETKAPTFVELDISYRAQHYTKREEVIAESQQAPNLRANSTESTLTPIQHAKDSFSAFNAIREG